jgi:hypothetical protein
MKYKGRARVRIFTVVVVLVVACVGILFVEAQTKTMRRWIDDVIYDNRNHNLLCEQLPSVSEVEKVLEEHHNVIQQIEAVNPGFVGIEVNTCGTGNADITFWYGSHQDRIVIEQIIGGASFFGTPYNLQNR